MGELIYFEDRDIETGHGWRDHPHVLKLDGEHIKAYLEYEDGGLCPYGAQYASCSYAWITSRASFEKTGYRAVDELRTRDVEKDHPKFLGGDDMEGHFEFGMTPSEMKKHLEALGIKNGESL